MRSELAYIIGFLQADGHLSSESGKGKLRTELSIKDKDILSKIGSILTSNFSIRDRTRDTNFKDNYTSSILTICDQNIRKFIHECGVPEGNKSYTVNTPYDLIDSVDYWRGFIDGDGSLGFTKQGFPFLSLNASSENIAVNFINFLEKLIGKRKRTSRNNRDNTYNICITKEDAQLVIRKLYYENCLALNRKKRISAKIKKWERPATMKKRNASKPWLPIEDTVVLENDNKNAAMLLNRNIQSIKMRRWRLSKKHD